LEEDFNLSVGALEEILETPGINAVVVIVLLESLL
jgi:hypothetical protein